MENKTKNILMIISFISFLFVIFLYTRMIFQKNDDIQDDDLEFGPLDPTKFRYS
jgi:hypothetical protein